MSKTMGPKAIAALRRELLKKNGRAACVGIRWKGKDDQEFLIDWFDETDGCKDPEDYATALMISVMDDFPDRLFTVVANRRARFLAWRRRMAQVGIEHDTEDQALEAFVEAGGVK